MSENKENPKRRPVGRPPLHFQRVPVGLSIDAVVRIDILVGKNKRGEFIRQAVQEKLDRDHGGPATYQMPNAPIDVVPKAFCDWTKEDVNELARLLRRVVGKPQVE